MSPRHCCDCSSGHNGLHPANPLTPAVAARSRAALLAGASLVVIAAFGAPGAARAACVASQQTINRPTPGPIVSNGGGITIAAVGSISGGPDGVDAVSCSISHLTNAGAISGGAAGPGVAGGVGVSNSQTITALTNAGAGAIIGGVGGTGATGAAGGAGMSNAGTVTKLGNNGTILGGNGGNGSLFGGFGGAGVSNSGRITKLSNGGTISGGKGGAGGILGLSGGAGLSNTGAIATLSNAGTIITGTGHTGITNGAALVNGGRITSLTNTGTISGVFGGTGSGVIERGNDRNPDQQRNDQQWHLGAAQPLGMRAQSRR